MRWEQERPRQYKNGARGSLRCLNVSPAISVRQRFAGIRRLGKAKPVADPWPIFVRKVAQCFRKVGLRPTATGRVYEGGKPTWFQGFMAALDKNLLGIKRLIGTDREDEQFERDHRAFYAEIAKAMRG